jgi:hypothetical protein
LKAAIESRKIAKAGRNRDCREAKPVKIMGRHEPTHR